MKFNSLYGGQQFMRNIFTPAAEMVAGTWTVREYVYNERGNPIDYNYKRPLEGRAWFKVIYNKYQLHPAVNHVIEIKDYCPKDWQQLLLEWPHKAESDPNRLAYTQDEKKGERNIQTITTIGKYLARHFAMPDHEIRDVVALFVDAGTMEIRRTKEEIVESARQGPTTCMGGKRFDITCADGVVRHPYEAYDPALGWSVAVRINEGRIDGRALIYTDPSGNGEGYFVRSFKRDLANRGGYSYTDETLEAWLKAQGIKKCDDWEGAHLAAHRVCGGYLAPYIDGGVQLADYCSLTKSLVISSSGDYDCESTSGTTRESGEQCEDCDDHFDEDDMYSVGRNEDRRVCSGCIDNYTYAYSRRGYQCYVDNDDAVYVGGDYYDTDYLSDNNIVELHDGDYEHVDNTVYIESSDEYYHCDDRDICYAQDTNRYELTEDCWQCEESQDWYTTDVDYIEVDGCRYHPDHAPEQADADNTETN